MDLTDGSYQLLKAVCAMDVGKVINPLLARGNVVGAIGMGLGYATTEGSIFDAKARPLNYRFRDFKIAADGGNWGVRISSPRPGCGDRA